MTSEFRAGSVVGGYTLDNYIGGGSFGAVWKGHSATGQAVAIKLLTGALSSAETAAMRADIELLAAAAAEHSQHVVHVVGGGGYPVPHIVMEYVEGSDLSTILKDTGKLTAGQTIDVGLAISDALKALSDAGIIHRDIKPANVMMDKDGVIKLTDFGIAKIVGYETMTMTGQAAMTMAYAAPEIWDDGSPFGKPSHKSDLYAMGVLLYQCVLGETPFRGNYGALYKSHMERAPDMSILPPETPPSLRALIAKCLEKRQDDRPRDAAECIAMLRRAEAELAETTGESGMTEPKKLGPWIKDSPHELVPWAWHAHHESKGDTATVEVHFAESLDYGAKLRKAVGASSVLAPLGAERIIDSNRLLLHPNEQWHEPPAGRFQFWIAREDRQVPAAPVVDQHLLGTAVRALTALLAAAEAQGVTLDPDYNLSLLPDGSIYLRRPGLVEPKKPAGESAIDALLALPLNAECRALVTSEHTLESLAAKLSAAPEPADDATRYVQPIDEGTVVVPSSMTTGAAAAAAAAASGFIETPAAAVSTPAPTPVQSEPAWVAATPAPRDVSLTLNSSTIGASRSEYELALQNNTNRQMHLRLDAFDDGQALAYSLTRQVTLPANASQVVRLRVEPQKPRKFGGKKTVPFVVSASGGGGSNEPPFTIEGDFSEQPPSWPLFAGAGVMGIAVAAVLAATMLSGGGGHEAKNLALAGEATATPRAVVTEAVPTATPVVVPTEVPPAPADASPADAPPADVPPPPAPNRMNCNAIRGTAYQSPEEGTWYQQNCSASTAVGGGATATGNATTGGGAGGTTSTTTTTQTIVTAPTWTPVPANNYTPPPPPPPPPAATSTPVPAPIAATYSFIGWATTSPSGVCAAGPTCSVNPGAVPSGGTLHSCNDSNLFLWIQLHNVKTPATLSSTVYKPDGTTVTPGDYLENNPEHAYWVRLGGQVQQGTYREELRVGGVVVASGSVKVVCP